MPLKADTDPLADEKKVVKSALKQRKLTSEEVDKELRFI
jgi:hypothetical protein